MSGLFSVGLGSVMRAMHKLRAKSLKWPLSCLEWIEKCSKWESGCCIFMGPSVRLKQQALVALCGIFVCVCVLSYCSKGWKGRTAQVGLLLKSPGTCRLGIFLSTLMMSLTFQQQRSPKHKVVEEERNKHFANSRAHSSVRWGTRMV